MSGSSFDIAESLGDMAPSLKKEIISEFKTGYQREMVKSGINHRKIATDNHRKTLKSIEGVGRLRMRVDPTHFHYWGQKLGYQCWSDKGFLHDVEKVHPELKTKCEGTKLQVGFGSKPKYHKAYNL